MQLNKECSEPPVQQYILLIQNTMVHVMLAYPTVAFGHFIYLCMHSIVTAELLVLFHGFPRLSGLAWEQGYGRCVCMGSPWGKDHSIRILLGV